MRRICLAFLLLAGCASSGVRNPSGVPVTEMRPDERGFVAGTGGATKLQIQFMVMRLLRLKSAPQPTDAADGVAAALAFALAPDLPRIEPMRRRDVIVPTG